MNTRLAARYRVLCALMAVTVHGLRAAAPEPARDVAVWLRWAIPLPKEIKIEQQVTVPASEVAITLRDDADALERNAARKLRTLLRDRAGVDTVERISFEILLGVCDEQGRLGDVTVPDTARLQELPNREQAYLIRPVGTDRLVLTALDSRGVFYAALTLRQLLESRFRGGSVTIPLTNVTDWPDMSERGEWGQSSTRDVEWFAEHKMNLVEFHTPHEVDKDGVSVTAINQGLLRRGRLNAVKTVPIISHLNGMARRGVYTAFPDLRGQGDTARHRGSTDNWAPCASNPKLLEIVAGWMRGYAAAGVRDICCWLSESKGVYCSCEACSKAGAYALETRAFVKAWQQARSDYPDLRIRVLLTQGSYSMNDKVLAEIPPEVGVTYYDGGRTYDSSRDPMIYPLLEEYAAGGRWLGCYPQLTPSWRIVSPWSCPQFVKYRMTEFVDKGLASLGGYVVPDNRLFDFNVIAAAEWSWNAHGRDEREFALAWATRKAMPQPDAVADWAVMLGPVAWDIYGARLVSRYFFYPGAIEGMVAARAKPAFGQGMFQYIPDAAHLARNLQVCRDATALAERCGSPAIKAETRAVTTYYEMLDQLCSICTLLAENTTLDVRQREALQQHTNRLVLAGALNVEALQDWERCVAIGAGRGRFLEGVQATEDSVRAVAQALGAFGIRDPGRLLMSRRIGGWKLEDFREGAEIVKTFDVTENILGPGTYRVTFQYAGGWNGLGTRRAALVAQPQDGSGAPVELSVDEHMGSIGHRSEGNMYALKLEEHDPAMLYLVVSNVRGTPPQVQAPGRTGCSGVVYFRREREPDWQVRVMSVKPLAADEAAATLKTGFTGTGIRVGVVVGGYGSNGMLELFEKSKDFDALPIGVGRLRDDECQVIILPQFRSGMVPDGLAEEAADFVRRGGGLIATHDAVGYRSMPKVCTEVCAGGVEHIRNKQWQVSADHPVAKGLPRDRLLTQSYYDHVQLGCGPKGTVVATAETSGKPVVVAGSLGKGRYVACGLLVGFSADSQEVIPSPDESALLLNAATWCAGQ